MIAKDIANRIDIAMRRQPADLVIQHVRLFDLVTGEFRQVDIAVCRGMIAAVGQGYEGKQVIDGTGLTAVPGFVDAHCHIESSMLTPYEWQKAVLAHGTTSAVCDPHELANVAGTAGIDYFHESSASCLMHLEVHTPSCVPALPSEEAGAVLDSEAIKHYAPAPGLNRLGYPLAEMMNVPGILNKDPDVLAKLARFRDLLIDGHAPLVSGDALQAICAAGISNDHESSNVEEALEKLRAGLTVFLRCGSLGRDLPRLTSLLNLTLCDRLCLCTDDREPLDILEDGHMDAAVRLAIHAGCDPLAVYRAVCLTPAKHFGWKTRGLLAPGYVADIVLLSDFANCRVEKVICGGTLVEETSFEGETIPDATPFFHSVHCKELSATDFGEPTVHADLAIGVEAGTLLTQCLNVAEVPKESLAYAALIARHGKSDRIGRAWVHGFSLQRGAIASTVGHDSHNLCVIGANPEDMAVAANALRDCGGGYAVAMDGKITGLLPLPIGGLMSDKSAREVADQLTKVRAAALETGTTLASPLMPLAFLPLPVIPFARLTLDGLVRV